MTVTHKMAAKTSWHRYGVKLRHCHPVFTSRFRSGILWRLYCRVYASRIWTRRRWEGYFSDLLEITHHLHLAELRMIRWICHVKVTDAD